MELDAQDLEFFHREADKSFLERKRDRINEMRIAYHANADQTREEFDQIKWGLHSIKNKDSIQAKERKKKKDN